MFVKRSFILLTLSPLMLIVCTNGKADVIGYWPLDGVPDATVGEDGFEVNGPIDVVPDRAGNANGAYRFDGFEQYVEIPGGGGLDGVLGGTISMWANWTDFQDGDCCGGTFGSILARQANGQFSDNILTLSDSDPELGGVVWRQSGGPAPPLITASDPVGDGQWRHIAVTFGPLGSELFVDAVSQGTAVGNTPLNSNDAIPLTIGAWAGDGAGFSSSAIDDVAIFDDILSAAQISQLFEGTATPMDVGAGTPVGEIPPAEPPAGSIAATIHSVSSNLADSTGFDRTADYVVDLSGWNDGTHVINPEGTMWLNNGVFAEPNDLEPEITFDLGGVTSIESVKSGTTTKPWKGALSCSGAASERQTSGLRAMIWYFRVWSKDKSSTSRPATQQVISARRSTWEESRRVTSSLKSHRTTTVTMNSLASARSCSSEPMRSRVTLTAMARWTRRTSIS